MEHCLPNLLKWLGMFATYPILYVGCHLSHMKETLEFKGWDHSNDDSWTINSSLWNNCFKLQEPHNTSSLDTSKLDHITFNINIYICQENCAYGIVKHPMGNPYSCCKYFVVWIRHLFPININIRHCSTLWQGKDTTIERKSRKGKRYFFHSKLYETFAWLVAWTGVSPHASPTILNSSLSPASEKAKHEKDQIMHSDITIDVRKLYCIIRYGWSWLRTNLE